VNRASVLVALSVKDGAPYIAEAVESVLAQRGVDVHLVVYDNGSTDGTQEIVRGLGVELVENAEGSNFFHSMNRALAEHDADFLAPFAADDVMLDGNLRAKVRALQVSGAALAHGSARVVDEQGAEIVVDDGALGPDDVVTPPGFFRHVAPINRMLLPTAVLRCDALRAIGGFDPRSILCGDWRLWLALSLRYAVVGVREPLVRYRHHAGSGSVRGIADGRFAAHDWATLREAFADPLIPLQWSYERGNMIATKLLHTARLTEQAGGLRWTEGTAAYGLTGASFLQVPGEPLLLESLRQRLRPTGLALPAKRWSVLARLDDVRNAGCLVDALRGLGEKEHAGELAIAVAPRICDEAVAALSVAIDAGKRLAVEVDVVPVDDDEDLYAGMHVYLGESRERLAAAERRGLPAFPFALPSPYARPRDPDAYELLPTAPADVAEAA
jgi:Glycosyl transferase family 2